jgi:hypothetical protein
LFASLAAYAQNYETTLTGTVLDTSGATIPNALIHVVNMDTDAVRDAKATGTGTYSVSNLPIGKYSLTVSADGFSPEQVNEIQLAVGQVRNLNVKLTIGSVKQEIQVEDTAAPLQSNTAEIGAVVETQQIKDLPLNGRNVASLLALVPGAIDSGGGTLSSIRFAGRGTDDTNFRLDGVDASGIRAQNPNTTLRLTTSTESLAELKVATLLYGADTGGTAGGQVELVSKSGTNRFHGSVFDFLRNNYFDAQGPFDVYTDPITKVTAPKTPNLKLNDFGASLGGPIFKNKTFFFVVFEGLRQRVSSSLTAVVPSASFRTAVLAKSPELKPFLDSYPTGNGLTVDVNSVNFNAPIASTQTESSGLFRVQHNFDSKNNLFVRYNIDQANISGASGALRDTAVTNTAPMNATVQYVHVFTPTLVNEAIVGFNRLFSLATTTGYLTATQGINYSISWQGFTALTNTKNTQSAPSTYSFLDNITKTAGRHSIKAGVELKELHFNYNQAGVHSLIYSSTAAIINDRLDNVQITDDVPVHGLHKLESFAYAQDTYKLKPNLTITYGLRWAFLNTLHEVHGRSLAWDDVTCGGNCPQGGQFTIPVYTDFEPRLSFGWDPKFFNGKASLRGGVGVYHGEGQVGDLNAPSDNFTSLFNVTPAIATANAAKVPDCSPLTYGNIAPCLTEARALAGFVQPRGLARQRQDPRVTQYGVQVQVALPYRFILDTGFIGSYADHQFTRTYHNDCILFSNPCVRPNPNFGQVDYKDAINYGNFSAWQTSLVRQYRSGLRTQINYMWSHSINNGTTGGGESDYPNNDKCLDCEYASSDQDARHTISADAIYTLPIGHGSHFLHNGFVGNVLSGISVTSIYTFRSGLPINIVLDRAQTDIPDGNNTDHNAGSPNLRPDLVPGVSLTPPGGRSNVLAGQWINPAAFATPAKGTWGNAPRNLLRGPALWQADLGTAKRFNFTERVSGQFRAEIFNLLNRSQYANPSGNFSKAGAAQLDLKTQTDPTKIANDNGVLASFAQTTSVVNAGATGSGTPRRIQFGLRFEF